MNLKKNIFISLLLSVGFILSQITPPLLAGMRFDFLLSFIFIAIILTKDIKSTILIGFLGGILSAFASTFPGGEIANLIDKLIVSIYIFLLIKIFGNLNTVKLTVLSISGTFLSGLIFLFVANILVPIPISFKNLIVGIVIPAAIFNGLGTILLYKIINRSLKYANFELN